MTSREKTGYMLLGLILVLALSTDLLRRKAWYLGQK